MGAEGDKINELRGLTKADGSYIKNRDELIDKGLEKACPAISQEEKKIAVKKISNGEDGQVKVGNQIIDIGVLEYMVASSIQNIESETNPQYEYFDWISEGLQIISEMTHDGVTPEEFERRQVFLDDLDQRETEIKTCIYLYQQTARGTGDLARKSREKLEFLQNKWTKLLEIRSAVKNSTQNYADPQRKITEQDISKTQMYVIALRMLAEGREIPARIKAKLEMSYGPVFDYSISEKLIQNSHRETALTKKQTIDRINALRGRHTGVNKPVLTVQKQKFNSGIFLELENQNMLQRA